MKTVAVVPVKGLGLAKSRLGGLLTVEERSALVLDMLARVLDARRPPSYLCPKVYTP